jgi:RNA polymerase sigma factor (sigma-70 family)
MRMRDSELVASIVAGDPDGLAHAYDRYAEPLYKYCRSLLNDPADAADAVQDTFVVAASRLDSLRDPDRLRPWLYTVARNECLRILRARKTTSALDEAPEVTAEGADVSEDAERAELRALLQRAIGGLNPSEREVIELQLRQGLEAAEVASVLGVSRNHAHSLLSRARDQLEACLGVLLVGRAGRDECEELGSMLSGWDGRLTILLRKRVHRHIEHCATCTTRRAFVLRPAMFLGLSPLAGMAAAAAESFRLAEGAPAGLKGHVLRLATGQDPSAVAHRAAVLGRAGSFGRHGFPKPVHGAHAGLAHGSGAAGLRGLRQSRQGQAAMAAGTVLAVVIAAVAFALTGNSEHVKLSGGKPPHSAPPGNAPAPASPAPTAPAPSRGAKHTPAAPTPSVAPRPAVATSSAPTPSPRTPTASPTPRPPSPTPPSRTPTPQPSSPPAPGTLIAAPGGGPLAVLPGGTPITLTAEGGPVSWSIGVSGGLGSVRATPSSGTLAAGQSVTVMITASELSAGEQLTVSPGGLAFTVLIGWGQTLPLNLQLPGIQISGG